MKATGVIRRVDELGRIVVPKEIRKNLRIRTGTPLEIFVDSNGSMVFKKHSAIAEIEDFGLQITEAIHLATELNAMVADMDKIVASSGDKKRDYMGFTISNALEEAISNRKTVLLNKADGAKLIAIKRDENPAYASLVICPILANGDCFGAVVVCQFQGNAKFGDGEIKLAQTMAQFLSKHLEN